MNNGQSWKMCVRSEEEVLQACHALNTGTYATHVYDLFLNTYITYVPLITADLLYRQGGHLGYDKTLEKVAARFFLET